MYKDLIDSSNDNILFVTEQCNNHCLMCCQPPQKYDDINRLFELNIQRIQNAQKGIKHIGITGGEPTLLGDKLVKLINIVRSELPDTLIHLLTNGRAFADSNYAAKLVEAGEGMLSFGIPLHSDYEKDHNIIAGNLYAYKETMYGFYNLAMNSAPIEVRIVINKLNYNRLPQISEYILKNLSFIEWVSFMAMERTGFADKHAHSVWVEPSTYTGKLIDACELLLMSGYEARIYNIPLCILPRNKWQLAYQSISEWKKKFASTCHDCVVRDKCCGLFSTSSTQFLGIESIKQHQE